MLVVVLLVCVVGCSGSRNSIVAEIVVVVGL